MWLTCGHVSAHICRALVSLPTSEPSSCGGWAPSPSSEGGKGGGGGGVVQPSWSNVHLDSWYFSQCLYFKAIHHAQGITSRPWIAELAPWEVFSCENCLGRTALPYEKKCFAFVIFRRQGKRKRLNALTGTFRGCISPLCPAVGWIWGSQTQVNGFGTDGNGLSVASANSHVFRFCLKCCVEVQSPRDVWLQSRTEQWREVQALRQSWNLGAEVLLMMGCCSALRGEVCGVILDTMGLTPKSFTLWFEICTAVLLSSSLWGTSWPQPDVKFTSFQEEKWSSIRLMNFLGFIPGTLGFTGLVTGRRSGLQKYNRKLN